MVDKKRSSIKDIAEHSGVSIATVSRVIHNNGRFSEETRKKVLKAIKDLNYEQNKLAVGLRLNKSNIIGILVPDITNEFYSNIVKKCEQNLFQLGYSCIVCNTERSSEREDNYLKVLSEYMVDGLIVISSNEIDEKKFNIKTPIVYIDRDPQIDRGYLVTSDHYGGAKEATKFLIENGYSPYMITSKTSSSSTNERIKAFNDTLSEQTNIKNTSSRQIKLNITSDKYLNDNKILDDFIQSIPHDSKTGIFAVNDYIAYMVVKSAQKHNISIPENLSIIGFDNAPISLISTPKITTVYQNIDKISELASELINKVIEGEASVNIKKRNLIRTDLIFRDSTI